MKSESSRHPKRLVFFEAAEKIRYHRYRIEYNRREREVVCPRYIFADGTFVAVMPWYLVPGRRYPIQVYLYACSMYCTDREIGQRGAAKATREKFKLGAFSHSTVSRSVREFELSKKLALQSRFGEEAKPCGPAGLTFVRAAEKRAAKTQAAPKPARRFPSAADTAARREGLAAFFRRFNRAAAEKDIKGIEAAGLQFTRVWHESAGRLLL